MYICSWCGKETNELIDHPLPDDDFIDICMECSLEDQEKHEERFSAPRLKTEDRTYARV